MKPSFSILILVLVFPAFAQTTDLARQERKPLTREEPERAAKAQELLEQARAALSQSAKFDSIQTLSVSGNIRRAAMTATASSGGATGSVTAIGGDVDPTIFGANNFKEYFADGKVEYDFSMPGKFRWQEDIGQQQRSGFFDGDRLWQKVNRNAVNSPPHAAPFIRQLLQSQFSYLTLGLLLAPPPGFPVEYSYAEEKPFRQTVAEVIVITGPGSFKTELYLDQTTHRPLLLRFVIGGIARPAMVFMPAGTSQQEGRWAVEIAQQQAEAKPPGAQEREKLVFFTDYRAVDGVLFPHKITTQINGKLIEEISFSQFKANQPINPEKFMEKK